jgi:hypothetical protein
MFRCMWCLIWIDKLTNLQLQLPIVHRIKLFGSFLGIIVGCTIGLFNLLLIDTDRSTELKKLEILHGGDIDNDDIILSNHHRNQSSVDRSIDRHDNNTRDSEINNNMSKSDIGGEYYQLLIEASNDEMETKHATMITIRGPPFRSHHTTNHHTPMDGLLSTITNALYNQNCSIVEIHASPSIHHGSSRINQVTSGTDTTTTTTMIRNNFYGTFYVIKRDTKMPFTNDELMDLVKKLTIETTPSSVLMNEPATTKQLRKLVRRYSVAVHNPPPSSS